MGLERFGGRVDRYGAGGVRILKRITVNEDILVRGAAPFSRNDMSIVSGSDFVDYAYQALVPSILMVIVGCGRSFLFQ